MPIIIFMRASLGRGRAPCLGHYAPFTFELQQPINVMPLAHHIIMSPFCMHCFFPLLAQFLEKKNILFRKTFDGFLFIYLIFQRNKNFQCGLWQYINFFLIQTEINLWEFLGRKQSHASRIGYGTLYNITGYSCIKNENCKR